jgi:N-acetylneuraminic acid mutarotase
MKKLLFLSFIIINSSFVFSAQGVWIQKADFGGVARGGATGFAIGTKGYIGTGSGAGINVYYQDFWEWDQSTNAWTQKANFGGTKRTNAIGFSIGTKGYIGTGYNDPYPSPQIYFKDFWEYTPDSTNGVNEIDLENLISVYPNPSKGKINLKLADLKI